MDEAKLIDYTASRLEKMRAGYKIEIKLFPIEISRFKELHD
jgi:hypothetical protein